MRTKRVVMVLILFMGAVIVLPSGAGAVVSDFCVQEAGWPVIVCDDFSASDPLAAYRLENPRRPIYAAMQISIVDEALVFQHRGGFGVAAAFRVDAVQMRDTTFEADVTLSSASSAIAGIEWEVDLDNRLVFWIGLNRTRIDIVDNGSGTSSPEVPFGIVPDRSYHLRLDVIGDSRLVASIDGATVLDFTYDLSFMPPTAFPGFLSNSYGPTGTFDDMTVRIIGEDLCPGTVLPDVLARHLKKNRYAATVDGFASTDGVVVYTLADTGGCSATQIIERAGLGKGHTKFGISRSALEAWIASID
jgi:hypothetical protein